MNKIKGTLKSINWSTYRPNKATLRARTRKTATETNPSQVTQPLCNLSLKQFIDTCHMEVMSTRKATDLQSNSILIEGVGIFTCNKPFIKTKIKNNIIPLA